MQQVANFNIFYHQYLSPDGELVQPSPSETPSNAQLLKCYRIMVLTRVFDKKAVTLQRTGRISTYPPILGEEAISTVIGQVMRPTDIFVPYYREQATQLQRGVTMLDLLNYWGGSELGNQNPSHPQDFPISVPISTQTLHAVGAAMAAKIKQTDQVVVCVCGDGATSKGDFYEATNCAGAWQVPVVFVVSNNQWAISMRNQAQTAAQTFAQKAVAAGFEGEQVDGNDPIALFIRLEKALRKARAGEGPTLIETLTYRLGDHTTADDASRYRSAQEVENAWKNEPIARLRHYLTSQGLWNHHRESALLEECRCEVDGAYEAFLRMEAQPATSMFDSLYATLPKPLNAQRDALKRSMSHE